MPDLLRDFSRSRAVLIGVGTYTHLPPVKAALNSLARFTSVLTGPLCAWPADRISVLSDVRQPGDLPDRLVELFEPAKDVALFYYVGHGQVDPFDTLCLGLVDSRKEATRRRTTSLPFDAVRHALVSSRARTKIVILDCCYAGLAAEGPGSLTAPDMLDHTRGTGAYTLAAAGEFATAWYDTDTAAPTPQTYFTQYLVDVIEAGIAGEGPDLALEPIFYAALDALTRDGKPLPTSRATGQATRIVFARNAAAIPLSPSRPVTAIDSPQPGHSDLPPQDSLPAAQPTPAQDEAPEATREFRVERMPESTNPVAEPADEDTAQPADDPLRVSGPSPTTTLDPYLADAQPAVPEPVSPAVPLTPSPAPAENPSPLSRRRVLVSLSAVAAAGAAAGVIIPLVLHDADSKPDDHPIATATQLGKPLTGHTGEVLAVAVGTTLNGKTIAVSGSNDRTLRVWDLATGKQLGELLTGHTGPVWAVAVGTLNGKTIAVSGSIDRTLRVWDLATGKQLGKPLTGHTGYVSAVAIGT
ncbi:caspase, EACC1-associated type, partial [Nonomuraea sp. NPDC003707]